MPSTHARFSPSAANRRLHCPPSLMLEEQFQDEESAYAAEGTAGHAMAEHLIKKYLKQRTRRPVSDYYSDELLEAVDEYVSFVQGEIEEARRVCKDPVFTVEQRVDASDYVEGCFGTADMVIVTDSYIHIIDLKLGRGVQVDAERNPQLMIYGLGVLSKAELLYDPKVVRLTIFQPRLCHCSTWEITPEELKKWGEEVLRPTGAMALMGAGEFAAGSWCRFCKARNQCRARAEEFLKLAQMEFRQPACWTMRRSPKSSAARTSWRSGRQTCMPSPRTRPSSTESSGPASRSSRAAPFGSTVPRRRSSLRPRPAATTTFSRKRSSALATWSGSWARRSSSGSLAPWSTSPRAS